MSHPRPSRSRSSPTASKALDLLFGGGKHAGKILDKLGISQQEYALFTQQQLSLARSSRTRHNHNIRLNNNKEHKPSHTHAQTHQHHPHMTSISSTNSSNNQAIHVRVKGKEDDSRDPTLHSGVIGTRLGVTVPGERVEAEQNLGEQHVRGESESGSESGGVVGSVMLLSPHSKSRVSRGKAAKVLGVGGGYNSRDLLVIHTRDDMSAATISPRSIATSTAATSASTLSVVRPITPTPSSSAPDVAQWRRAPTVAHSQLSRKALALLYGSTYSASITSPSSSSSVLAESASRSQDLPSSGDSMKLPLSSSTWTSIPADCPSDPPAFQRVRPRIASPKLGFSSKGARRLGVSDKELELFFHQPKAHKQLGVGIPTLAPASNHSNQHSHTTQNNTSYNNTHTWYRRFMSRQKKQLDTHRGKGDQRDRRPKTAEPFIGAESRQTALFGIRGSPVTPSHHMNRRPLSSSAVSQLQQSQQHTHTQQQEEQQQPQLQQGDGRPIPLLRMPSSTPNAPSRQLSSVQLLYSSSPSGVPLHFSRVGTISTTSTPSSESGMLPFFQRGASYSQVRLGINNNAAQQASTAATAAAATAAISEDFALPLPNVSTWTSSSASSSSSTSSPATSSLINASFPAVSVSQSASPVKSFVRMSSRLALSTALSEFKSSTLPRPITAPHVHSPPHILDVQTHHTPLPQLDQQKQPPPSGPTSFPSSSTPVALQSSSPSLFSSLPGNAAPLSALHGHRYKLPALSKPSTTVQIGQKQHTHHTHTYSQAIIRPSTPTHPNTHLPTHTDAHTDSVTDTDQLPNTQGPASTRTTS